MDDEWLSQLVLVIMNGYQLRDHKKILVAMFLYDVHFGE
jgi:hypothetical protein